MFISFFGQMIGKGVHAIVVYSCICCVWNERKGQRCHSHRKIIVRTRRGIMFHGLSPWVLLCVFVYS